MRDVKVVANPWSWSARVATDVVDARAALRSAAVKLASEESFVSPVVVALRVLDAAGGAVDRLAAAAGLSGRVVGHVAGTPDSVSVQVRSEAAGFGGDVVSVSLLEVPALQLGRVLRSGVAGSGCSAEDVASAALFVRDAVGGEPAAWDVVLDLAGSSAGLSMRVHRAIREVAA